MSTKERPWRMKKTIVLSAEVEYTSKKRNIELKFTEFGGEIREIWIFWTS